MNKEDDLQKYFGPVFRVSSMHSRLFSVIINRRNLSSILKVHGTFSTYPKDPIGRQQESGLNDVGLGTSVSDRVDPSGDPRAEIR